jgi:hypothetical protein
MIQSLKQIKKQRLRNQTAIEGLFRSMDAQLHVVALMNVMEKMGRFGKFTRKAFEEELAKVKHQFAEQTAKSQMANEQAKAGSAIAQSK